MIDRKIIKTLAEISSTDNGTKQLNLMSWNGAPAKLDLRSWRKEGEKLMPGKGMTLTDAEAQALYKALHDYLATLPPQE